MFGIGSKKVLGVDAGNYSIKIVELEKKGKMKALNNYGEILVLPEEKKEEGNPANVLKTPFSFPDGNIAHSISQLLKEMKAGTNHAVFSIPDYATFFTNLNIPTMGKKEIAEAVQYEVRPYIPMPLSEITLDWTVTNGEPGKTAIEVLVAAVPNDIISHYREIASASGLKLKSLEPEAFALARSAYWSGYQGVVAVIDIGARTTNCSIMDNGILKISYSFNIAGNELTERLARSFNIDYNKAESIKKENGLIKGKVTSGVNEPEKIFSISIDSLVEEVKKIIRDFYQEKGKEAEKIVLSGGTALLPGLKDYLFSQFKKEINILNPFANVLYPGSLKDVVEKIGPFYGVAAGLALKGTE